MTRILATLHVQPPEDMRVPSVDDWSDWPGKHGLSAAIITADTGNEDYNFLILLHSLVECYLCHKAGVTAAEVDAFDIGFEAERAAGKHPEDVEPGDSPDAPYWLQHQRATTIETTMAAFLGVDWVVYEACLNGLAVGKDHG